jgi:hypothetical protein
MIKDRDDMLQRFLEITWNPTERELIILNTLADATFHQNEDGGHVYFGTYCHHDDHDNCKQVCKTCASPCVCYCHR